MERREAAWPVVATREIMARLTDRNFLVSTGFTLVLIVGIFAVQAFVAARSGAPQIAVTGAEGAEATQIVRAAGEGGVPGAQAPEPVDVPDAAAARAALADGSVDAWLHRDGGAWVLTGQDEPGPLLAAGLGAAVRDHVMAANATAAGTSMATLEAGSRLSVRAVSDGGGGEAQAVNRIAGAVFAMLFYIASVMFGMAIASSVVEAKQSRIVEILATAIPLRQLLVGKVLGNAALAMGQLVLFVGVALVGVSFTDSGAMLPGLLGPSAWFLVFFAVGFVALACVWAVCGSLASRTEDLQATTMPMTMLLVGLLLLGLMGSGTTQVIASYVPIASVVTMPARLLAGTAAWWEPVLSLALTLAAAAALIAIAGRIYRRSLLQTGGRLSLRQALRVQE